MDRSTRHQIKHDKFVDDMGEAYKFAGSHRRMILAVIAGIAAIAIVSYGVLVYRARREQDAQAKLAEAIRILETPVTQPGATPDPSTPSFKSEQERTAKAEPLLQELSKNYAGSDAADVADLYLAQIASNRGDIAGAKEKLQRFVREHRDHILAGTAQLSLMELRIASDPAGDVVTELESQLKSEDSVLPKDSLLSLLARTHEMAGNQVKAAEAYQRLINEYPDSAYALEAQRKNSRV